VDILADGALDLEDETLAQMEIVVASVHTHFAQSREEMTARILRAMRIRMCEYWATRQGGCCCAESPSHWTRSGIAAGGGVGVAVEHNAAPERLT